MSERFRRLWAVQNKLRSRGGWSYLLAFMVSLGFAVAVWWTVDRLEQRRWSEWGQQFTRQISAQWEGLVFVGKRLGETLPHDWATRQLSQGVEARRMRVQFVATEMLGGQPEVFRWQPAEESFEFLKEIPGAEGAIRISVQAGQSNFVRDLTGVLVFIATYFVALWLIGRRQVEEVQEVTETAIYGESNPVISEFRQWLTENRQQLSTLGGAVRDMVKEAKELAVGSGRSRSVIAVLRERMHSGLNGLRQCSKDLHESVTAASQAEVNALNFLIEMNRSGGASAPLAAVVEEVHRSIREVRALQSRSAQSLRELELELEPWMLDVDGAFASHQNVFQTTRQLNAQISRTMQNLVEQAKWNQEAKRLLETHEQGLSRSWPEVG